MNLHNSLAKLGSLHSEQNSGDPTAAHRLGLIPAVSGPLLSQTPVENFSLYLPDAYSTLGVNEPEVFGDDEAPRKLKSKELFPVCDFGWPVLHPNPDDLFNPGQSLHYVSVHVRLLMHRLSSDVVYNLYSSLPVAEVFNDNFKITQHHGLLFNRSRSPFCYGTFTGVLTGKLTLDRTRVRVGVVFCLPTARTFKYAARVYPLGRSGVVFKHAMVCSVPIDVLIYDVIGDDDNFLYRRYSLPAGSPICPLTAAYIADHAVLCSDWAPCGVYTPDPTPMDLETLASEIARLEGGDHATRS